MPGDLPQISWETTKVVEEGSEEEAPAGVATSGSRTVVVRKKVKKLRLDIFDRAAETKKPVFVYFTAERCDPCRTMEKLTLRQKQVTDAAKRYHSVQIVTDFVDPDLLKAYKVKQAPTIILFNYDGKPSTRMDGKQSHKVIAEAFRQVAERNRKKAEAEAEKAEKAEKAGAKKDEAAETERDEEKRVEERDREPERPPAPGDEPEGEGEAEPEGGKNPRDQIPSEADQPPAYGAGLFVPTQSIFRFRRMKSLPRAATTVERTGYSALSPVGVTPRMAPSFASTTTTSPSKLTR